MTEPSKDAANGPVPGNAGDPSMEDILASIRRILSEEEPASHPPPEKHGGDDDVLMLEASMMVDDPDPFPAPPSGRLGEPEAAPYRPAQPYSEPPAVAPIRSPIGSPRELVAPEAAAAAASSVGSLVRSIAAERSMQVHSGGPTIEDVVRTELRPLLKQWLDQNLPPMVERLVRAELERVIGRASP